MIGQPSAGPLRPPSEAYSLLVRVTKNCPWNRCEFCSAFRGKRFEKRPVTEIKDDILRAGRSAEEVRGWADRVGSKLGDAGRFNGLQWLHDDGVKSVFLQDSDSLVLTTDPLVEILEFIRATFPTVERICTYARGKTIFRKAPEALKRLRNAGLTRLHIGLETGDEALLSRIKKGVTADEMVEACRKAIDAGIEVSTYVISGLGGRERWEQHALHSARVLNRIDPHFIRLRTFHLVEGTPIYERARRKAFHLLSIEGVLKEIRRFIAELDVSSELVTSDYAYNYFLGEVDGKLPQDKERLLIAVDDALDWWRSRGEPKRNPFLGSLNRERAHDIIPNV